MSKGSEPQRREREREWSSGCMSVVPHLLVFYHCNKSLLLIDLFDGWSTSAGAGWGTIWGGAESTWHTACWGSAGLCELGHDWHGNLFQFLLLIFVLILLGGLIGLQPGEGLVGFIHDRLLIFVGDLVLNFFILHSGFEAESVGFQGVLGSDSVSLLLVFLLVLLGVVDHAFDVLFAETTFVVGDGDFILLSSALIDSGYVKDGVGVDIEGWFCHLIIFSERVGIGANLRGPFRFRGHFLGPVKSSTP